MAGSDSKTTATRDDTESRQLEQVLRSHPGVADAAVIGDGENPRKAFVVPDDAYLDDVLGRAAAQKSLLGKWRKTYDLSQLVKGSEAAPVGFNILGWNSSYTRQPIAAEEMREWLLATISELLPLAPQRVYEIGCGSGMLVMAIAPHCEEYLGVDFSPVVLARLKDQLQQVPALFGRVQVMERTADDFGGMAAGSFDTVLINSVTQHFPSLAYMTRVLEKAVDIVRPGGRIYVGDNRHLGLLPAFATSVELFQAGDGSTAGELRERIQRRIRGEQQLLFSPAYFLSLRRRFRKLSRIEIHPRRGRADNEMSRYRFNVILHVGDEGEPALDLPFEDWAEQRWTLDGIRSLLQRNRRAAIKNIPNARLVNDLAALQILRTADAAYTAGQVRAEVHLRSVVGIHPEDLIQLGTELGFGVALSWAACRDDGSYDAAFVPKGSGQIMWPEPSASEFVHLANAPGQLKFREELMNRLQAHCRESGAKNEVPPQITLVDMLPSVEGRISYESLLAARVAEL